MTKDDPDLREWHLENDEIDSIVWDRCCVSLPEPNPDLELWNAHLEKCQYCSEVVNSRMSDVARLRQAAAAGSSEKDVDCPQETVWTQVAAGLISDPKVRLHAAQCLYCGPQLREAVAALHAEPSPEETASILQNRENPASEPPQPTSSRRREMSAAATASHTRTPSLATPKVQSWPVRHWWLALAASVAVIVGVAYYGYTRQVDDPERLLARVYSTHRTVEWRFPGLPQSPVRQFRGHHGSDAETSPELLRLRARVAEQVAAHPDDLDWILADGRLNLLLWRYDAALSDFKHAAELHPDSTAALSDMAGACFERAEATGGGTYYGESVELLSKVLASHPGDGVALFNRGLAEERLYLYSKAAADWEEALKREPSGAWASEIKTRLADVKKKTGRH